MDRTMRNRSSESHSQTSGIGDKLTNILTTTGQLVLLGRQPPISKTISTSVFTMQATRFTKQNPSCGDLIDIKLSSQLIDRTLEHGTDQSENAIVDCLLTQFGVGITYAFFFIFLVFIFLFVFLEYAFFQTMRQYCVGWLVHAKTKQTKKKKYKIFYPWHIINASNAPFFT